MFVTFLPFDSLTARSEATSAIFQRLQELDLLGSFPAALLDDCDFHVFSFVLHHASTILK
jgi:hypothetical protein